MAKGVNKAWEAKLLELVRATQLENEQRRKEQRKAEAEKLEIDLIKYIEERQRFDENLTKRYSKSTEFPSIRGPP